MFYFAKQLTKEIFPPKNISQSVRQFRFLKVLQTDRSHSLFQVYRTTHFIDHFLPQYYFLVDKIVNQRQFPHHIQMFVSNSRNYYVTQ